MLVDGVLPGTERRALAYNLTVRDLHRYFVATASGTAVLIHNDCNEPVHAMYRGATREVDVDRVVADGDIYQQKDGRRAYVLSNEDGTSSAVILDGPLTDGLVTVLESVPDTSLADRVADGFWTATEDL